MKVRNSIERRLTVVANQTASFVGGREEAKTEGTGEVGEEEENYEIATGLFSVAGYPVIELDLLSGSTHIRMIEGELLVRLTKTHVRIEMAIMNPYGILLLVG